MATEDINANYGTITIQVEELPKARFAPDSEGYMRVGPMGNRRKIPANMAVAIEKAQAEVSAAADYLITLLAMKQTLIESDRVDELFTSLSTPQKLDILQKVGLV